jgi:hypothetical protein
MMIGNVGKYMIQNDFFYTQISMISVGVVEAGG